MTTRESLTGRLRDQANAGLSVEDAVATLHAEKLSPIEAIKAIMEAYDLSLGEAKSVVTAHPKWADTTARAAELHDALITQSDGDP